MQHLVFVYGTLRKGECNHHLLESSEYLGMYETEPDYQLFDLGEYPGLSDGKSSVTGEVYHIDEATLAKLDLLEDVPVEYRRESINTPFGSAWIYIYQDVVPEDQVIDSGNWLFRGE
ncbi:gamma-glutamylcyclotransferase [Vibrio sp. JC009]|uniref:gamma-glutamylcyclotransferase family protein n=1 Tax=Vibrio sp. JC009 TaxID=2912314 RepID=UPI0023B15521|nr:gamma-glutamylcyclotransferase [Vibrio sp. JC009]WED22127.1 gamma-glutamylcyclotransferase [Vibrio sp. JC009]